MYTLKKKNNFSLVKAIVRKNKGRDIADEEFLSYCHDATVMKARGALLRPKWYQAFLPSLNPSKLPFFLIYSMEFFISIPDSS